MKVHGGRVFGADPGDHLVGALGAGVILDRGQQGAAKACAARVGGKDDRVFHAGRVAVAAAKLAIGGKARDPVGCEEGGPGGYHPGHVIGGFGVGGEDDGRLGDPGVPQGGEGGRVGGGGGADHVRMRGPWGVEKVARRALAAPWTM